MREPSKTALDFGRAQWRVSAEIAQEMYRLRKQGISVEVIARRMHYTRQTVYNILRREARRRGMG